MNMMLIIDRLLPACLLFEKPVGYREGRHCCERFEASYFPLISFRLNLSMWSAFRKAAEFLGTGFCQFSTVEKRHYSIFSYKSRLSSRRLMRSTKTMRFHCSKLSKHTCISWWIIHCKKKGSLINRYGFRGRWNTFQTFVSAAKTFFTFFMHGVYRVSGLWDLDGVSPCNKCVPKILTVISGVLVPEYLR